MLPFSFASRVGIQLKTTMKILKTLSILLFISGCISPYGVSGYKLLAPKTMFERLELSPKYFISWSIAEGSDEIIFQLNVETKGYVGFGLSPTGGMEGADMIIGGVFDNGTTYFSDRHGVKGNTLEDESEDWKLVEASETSTHTILKISRLLNTCDDFDIPITVDTAKLIWSYGETDSVEYHGRDTRGTKSTNLLTPPKIADMSGYKVWNITVETPVPKNDTTYWCTFHKSPLTSTNLTKLHIVGWDAIVLSEVAAKYTHHVDVKKCVAPKGMNATEIFEKYVDPTGVSCYDNPGEYPIRYCESYILTWAVGRGLTLLPENVGYAVGENPEEVYYVLEVHYDNPAIEDVPLFTTGLQIYYTETPREIDADILGVGYYTIFTLALPPNTDEFVISGHCASECTEYFPEEGLTVFSGLMHSHLSGRKIKLRHFRNGTELPWVAVDNNFDFNFQENKNMGPLKILRGDSFTLECTYSTTWKTGSAVVAGLGSRDEMCLSWLWYYPKFNMNYCYSFYPVEKNMQDFGIKNYTWVQDAFGPPPVIWEPKEMYGKSYQEVLDNVIDWTPERIKTMQEDHRYGEHDFFCHSIYDGFFPVKNSKTKYVQVDKDICTSSASYIHKFSCLTFLAIFYLKWNLLFKNLLT